MSEFSGLESSDMPKWIQGTLAPQLAPSATFLFSKQHLIRDLALASESPVSKEPEGKMLVIRLPTESRALSGLTPGCLWEPGSWLPLDIGQIYTYYQVETRVFVLFLIWQEENRLVLCRSYCLPPAS